MAQQEEFWGEVCGGPGKWELIQDGFFNGKPVLFKLNIQRHGYEDAMSVNLTICSLTDTKSDSRTTKYLVCGQAEAKHNDALLYQPVKSFALRFRPDEQQLVLYMEYDVKARNGRCRLVIQKIKVDFLGVYAFFALPKIKP